MSSKTWLTENSDLTSFQIRGYTLISQGVICSSHAGLAIYVQEHYKYKLLSCYQHTKIWEGLFIEIVSKEFKKKVIIGNMYRPPRERNENYQSFLNELWNNMNRWSQHQSPKSKSKTNYQWLLWHHDNWQSFSTHNPAYTIIGKIRSPYRQFLL